MVFVEIIRKYFTNKYYDISLFKSLGLIEILFSIPKFIKIINKLSNKILINNYDLVICVDSPDFNYQLAKKIKKNNYQKKNYTNCSSNSLGMEEGKS